MTVNEESDKNRDKSVLKLKLTDIIGLMENSLQLCLAPLWKTNGARILVYHTVDCPKDSTFRGAFILPEMFKKQMRVLIENGYKIVSIDQIAAALSDDSITDAQLDKFMSITFDDGFFGIYKYVFPTLVQFNIPATVFVTIDLIEQKISPPGYYLFPENRYIYKPLSWSNIQEMNRSGLVSFGGHTVSHPNLTMLSKNEVLDECKRCKVVLEDRIGQRVTAFAYPFGVLNQYIKEAVVQCGYSLARTTQYGPNKRGTDAFLLRGIGVSNLSPVMLRFKATLKGNHYLKNMHSRIVYMLFPPQGWKSC